MHVHLIDPEDDAEWLRLRRALWSKRSAEEHGAEMRGIRCNLENAPVFVAGREAGGLCGFLEASLRSYADGCSSRPVGYIEGWYVDPDMRQSGVGGVLVEMAEAWAILRGCTEMASDCEIDNRLSQEAHQALGYHEAERLIHFRKSLMEHVTRTTR